MAAEQPADQSYKSKLAQRGSILRSEEATCADVTSHSLSFSRLSRSLSLGLGKRTRLKFNGCRQAAQLSVSAEIPIRTAASRVPRAARSVISNASPMLARFRYRRSASEVRMLHRLRDSAMSLPRARATSLEEATRGSVKRKSPAPGNDVTESSTELTVRYPRDKSILPARVFEMLFGSRPRQTAG